MKPDYPSGWPRYIRLKNEWSAVEAAKAEQAELERRYPLTRAGKRATEGERKHD